MRSLPDASVDLILCDPPYGITNCAWDTALPSDALFDAFKRIKRPNAAMLLFATQPYATELINANRKAFRYEIIWIKNRFGNFLNAKRMPLRAHENILVFYDALPTYHPQKHTAERSKNSRGRTQKARLLSAQGSACYRDFARPDYKYLDDGTRYPCDVVSFPCVTETGPNRHPTQKPVPLLSYLIRTYSSPGDLVLDACMGSGSTGVAAVQAGRRFVGFETDAHFFDVAKRRILAADTGVELDAISDPQKPDI